MAEFAALALNLRVRLGKMTSLALYVFNLWTLACRPSRDRFFRLWSTAMPIVGASFFGIPAACICKTNNSYLTRCTYTSRKKNYMVQNFWNNIFWLSCSKIVSLNIEIKFSANSVPQIMPKLAWIWDGRFQKMNKILYEWKTHLLSKVPSHRTPSNQENFHLF